MATFAIADIQIAVDNKNLKSAKANEAITAGRLLYLDTDGELNVADNTNSAKVEVEGIAVQDADIGNECPYVTAGNVQVGNILVVGDSYILSTAGQLQLAGDLLSTGWLSAVGAAVATDEIEIVLKNYGVQKA